MTDTNHGLNIIVCSSEKTKSTPAGGTNPPGAAGVLTIRFSYRSCLSISATFEIATTLVEAHKRCCYVSMLWWLTSWMNWLCRQIFLVLPPHVIQLTLYHPGFTLHVSPLSCALRRWRRVISDRSDLEHVRETGFCEFVEKQLDITGTIWFQTRSH